MLKYGNQAGIGGEIADQMVIWTEKVPVFGSVFDSHAPAHGSKFEGAHGMTVAICPADQAEIDGGIRDDGREVFGSSVAIGQGG